MGFASEWLQSGPVFPELIKEAPYDNTGIIVVIPSYDEAGIVSLLDSLAACEKPQSQTEVIIVVNAPASADEESLSNNRSTVIEAKRWESTNEAFFRLFIIDTGVPSIRGWGVGLARKTGMDEALRRFSRINREDGVIACLDADCTVATNYFQALEEELLKRPERKACSVYFEHPLSGNDHPAEVYNAIVQYEIHLRYYLLALRYTGFPNVYHTVGSTLAVKAHAYMKAGGMNRRQAGEDFYFVQKLLPSGGFFSLSSTTVFPSPRISGRVPFGTGAAIGKMVGREEEVLLTYCPESFYDLRLFFETSDNFYKLGEKYAGNLYAGLPGSVRSFIAFNEWHVKMVEIKENTASHASFRKRFFEWFNMFRIVKYLNFVHESIFRKIPVSDAAKEIIAHTAYFPADSDPVKLLLYLRKTEKERN